MKRVDDIAKSNLSLPAKWLAVFMIRHQNRKGEVTATLSDIRVWTSLSTRAIQYALEDLERAGFISVLTPFQRTANSSAKFVLTLRDASGASRVSAIVTQEMRQVVSENAENDAGTVDSLASAGAPVSPLSILSGSLSSPVQEDKQLGMESVSESAHEIHPAWLTQLHDIPTWKCSYDDGVIEKVASHGITAEHALLAATALVGKWDGRKYKRPDATFKNWALNEKKRTEERNGKSQGYVSAIEAGRAGAFADSSRYERLAEEQRLRSLQ